MIHLNCNVSTVSTIGKSTLFLCGTALLIVGIWQLYHPFIHTTLSWGMTSAAFGWTFASAGIALTIGATLWSIIERIKANGRINGSSLRLQSDETTQQSERSSQKIVGTFLSSPVMPPILALHKLTKNPVEQVPKEIWVQIFSRLDLGSILNCQRVCKAFRYAMHQDSLWKNLRPLIKNLEFHASENGSFKKALALSHKIETCIERNRQSLNMLAVKYNSIQSSISYTVKAENMLFIGIGVFENFHHNNYLYIISLDNWSNRIKIKLEQPIKNICYSNKILICQIGTSSWHSDWLIWKKKENELSFERLWYPLSASLNADSLYFLNNVIYFTHSLSHPLAPVPCVGILQFKEKDIAPFLKPEGPEEDHCIEKGDDTKPWFGKMLFIQDEKKSTGRLFVASDNSIFIYSLDCGIRFVKSKTIELKHSFHIRSFFYEKGYLYCFSISDPTSNVTIYVWKENMDQTWSLNFSFCTEFEDCESQHMLHLFAQNNLKLLCSS